MTVEEFFVFEDQCPPGEKWELLGGRLVMMAGGTMRHAQIALNIASGLRGRLGRACRAYVADANVSEASRGVSAYPDVVVRCGPPLSAERTMTDPHLIVEVASPSTAHIDLGVKVLDYTGFETLQVYAVVRQDEARLEVWRRTADGWANETLRGLSAVLALPTLETSLPLTEIYEDVEGLEA
jgi:Uma2 family endonuclease